MEFGTEDGKGLNNLWYVDPFTETMIFEFPFLTPYYTIINWYVWQKLHRN